MYYITILTWHWKQFLVCCLLFVVELSNWLDVHKAAKAICSLKYADGWVLMSPFFPKAALIGVCFDTRAALHGKRCMFKAVHVHSALGIIPQSDSKWRWVEQALRCFKFWKAETTDFLFWKNTNVLDCRRLSLFKPCDADVLGHFWAQVDKFVLLCLLQDFSMNLGGRNKKILECFFRWDLCSKSQRCFVHSHLCHKAYESGFDFQFIFHLRFSRRLDSQLVTVYATMWQWLDRPHI